MYGTFYRITKYFVKLICDENSEVGRTLGLINRFFVMARMPWHRTGRREQSSTTASNLEIPTLPAYRSLFLLIHREWN